MIFNLGELKELKELNVLNVLNNNESTLVTENINDLSVSNLVTFKKITNLDGTNELGLYDAFGNIIARIKNSEYMYYNLQEFDYRIGLDENGNVSLYEDGNTYIKELDLGLNTNNTFLKYEETFFQDSIKYFYINSIPRLNMNLRVLPFLDYSFDRINFVSNINTINDTICIKPNTSIFIIGENENNERRVIKNTLKNKFKYIINKDAEYSLISSNQFDTSIQRFSEFEGSKTIKESIIVKTKDQYTMVSILDYNSLISRVYKYNTYIYDNYIDFNNKGNLIYTSNKGTPNYERFFDFCISDDKIYLIGLNIRPNSSSLDALELIKKTIDINTKVEQVNSYSNYQKDDNFINAINTNSIRFDIFETSIVNSLNNIIDINFRVNESTISDNSIDLIQIYFANDNNYHEVMYLVAKDDYFYLNRYNNYNTSTKLKIKYMSMDSNDVFITLDESGITSTGIALPHIDHFYNNSCISYELDINAQGVPLKDFDTIIDISFSIIPLYNSEDISDKIGLDIIYRTKNSSLIKHEVIVLGYTEFTSFKQSSEMYDPFYKITKNIAFIKFQDNYVIREDLISKYHNLEMFKGSFTNIIKEADNLLPELVLNNNTSITVLKGWLGTNIDDFIKDFKIKYIVEAPTFILKHSHDYGDNLYDITTMDYTLPVQYDFDIKQTQIVPDTVSKYIQTYLNCHFYFTNTNVNNKLNDKINCSLIGNIKNKYNFMDMFFELKTYNILIPEGSTSIPDDSIIIDSNEDTTNEELNLDNFVLIQ